MRFEVIMMEKNKAREERIHNEIIVDAYGPEEQAMGWYYCLEEKLGFPFKAKCIAKRTIISSGSRRRSASSRYASGGGL